MDYPENHENRRLSTICCILFQQANDRLQNIGLIIIIDVSLSEWIVLYHISPGRRMWRDDL